MTDMNNMVWLPRLETHLLNHGLSTILDKRIMPQDDQRKDVSGRTHITIL